MNDGYYHPGVSQVPIQVNSPDYGSHGGSQSNANANANANAVANGGSGGAFPGSFYYPVPSGPKVIGDVNANTHANAAGSGGVNVGNFPGIDEIEVIPVNTLPISQSTSPVYPPIYSTSHQPSRSILPGKGDIVIPIVIVEESPRAQYPYQRPPSYHHHHHRRPHYESKPKQQPVEIVIEESVPSQGTSCSST